MSKSDPFIEEYAPVPRGGYSDSQSPQAHRGTAQDYEQFSKGDVEDGLDVDQRVAPENAGASKVESKLAIDSINPRADPEAASFPRDGRTTGSPHSTLSRHLG